MELRSPYKWVYHNKDLIDGLWSRKYMRKQDAPLLRAAEGLLGCIQQCTEDLYKKIDGSMWVRWETLPLIFVSLPKLLLPSSLKSE